MPGLWKAWKAESRLPTLSTIPLGISPRAGEIPTFPQRRRPRRMEKWKTKSRFPTFPPPRIFALSNQKTKPSGGLRPPPPRRHPPSGPDLSQARSTKGDIAQQPHFQARPVLESKGRFRLIAHWNQFSISGSFMDWKMLSRLAPLQPVFLFFCGPLRRDDFGGLRIAKSPPNSDRSLQAVIGRICFS